MNRKEFLKGLGIAGAGSVLIERIPAHSAFPQRAVIPPGTCTLVPGETAGTTLLPGNYAYLLTTENSAGVFKQAKLLTLQE